MVAVSAAGDCVRLADDSPVTETKTTFSDP
jgi:hypothetical protein